MVKNDYLNLCNLILTNFHSQSVFRSPFKMFLSQSFYCNFSFTIILLQSLFHILYFTILLPQCFFHNLPFILFLWQSSFHNLYFQHLFFNLFKMSDALLCACGLVYSFSPFTFFTWSFCVSNCCSPPLFPYVFLFTT